MSAAQGPSQYLTDAATNQKVTFNRETVINGYTDRQFNNFKTFASWSRGRQGVKNGIWNNPGDMHGFSEEQAKQDLESIKVVSSTPAKKGARQCQPFDYYAVNYKGFIQDEGSATKLRQVLNS